MKVVSLIIALLFPCLVWAQSSLQIGDSASVHVPSNQIQFSCGINVLKGETYQLTATGVWQDAGFSPSDANGFKGFTAPMFFGMLLKPMPSQYYMKLCGRIGSWKFAIGTTTEISIKRTGTLELFANDAKGFFDNNSGTLHVIIERLH